jgi:serine protease AprX
MRIRRRRVLIAALATMLVATMPISAGARDGADGPDLRLRAETFTPAAGERADIPDHLRRDRADARDIDLYVVQFGGPIPTTALAELAAAGVEVLVYLPDFAYRVRGSVDAIAAVEARSDIVHVDLFQPAFKLDPSIGTADDSGIYRVLVSEGANPRELRSTISTSGMQVLSFSGMHLTIAASPDQLGVLADYVSVAWVSPFSFYETHNEFGAGAIMNADNAIALGYDGSTQIVAIADTGIGVGTVSGAHPDIPSSRVEAVHDWPTTTLRDCYRPTGDGAQDVDSGHGTHVAGSVLSDGGVSGEGMGTAPGASLVFQAVEDWITTGGSCSASPDGYYPTARLAPADSGTPTLSPPSQLTY